MSNYHKILSSILAKAQGVYNAERKASIDVGAEVVWLREICDKFSATLAERDAEIERLKAEYRDDRIQLNKFRQEYSILSDSHRAALAHVEALKQDESAVNFYEREFYPLSNFSSFNLGYKGFWFATSEHAYHWEKFMGAADVQQTILAAKSAHDAFKLAERNKYARRPDWDSEKVRIMRQILREKAAQHEYVRRKLLETGDRELIEMSWRDDFWGWGPNRDGQNMLGKLWMEIRTELKAKAARSAQEG